MAVENTHGLLAASHSHVKSAAVRQRLGSWLGPVVVSLLTQHGATVVVIKRLAETPQDEPL